jgi:hypothetical protein
MSLAKKVIITVTALAIVAGCASRVPMASSVTDTEAKSFVVASGKANLYVIRTCPFGGKMHQIRMDEGPMLSLACGTYAKFSVVPGKHQLTATSTISSTNFEVTTEAAQNYFVELGWNFHALTLVEKDVIVTLAPMNEMDGKEAVQASELIATKGY